MAQGDMPADYLADLRTLVSGWAFYPGPGYPDPITAQHQKWWLLYALHNYSPLTLIHMDETWGYNFSAHSLRQGDLPY